MAQLMESSSTSSYTSKSIANGCLTATRREKILLTGRRKAEYPSLSEDDASSIASTSVPSITLMVPSDAADNRRRILPRRRPTIEDVEEVLLKFSESRKYHTLRMEFPRNNIRRCRSSSYKVFAYYILQMVLNAMVLSGSVASALPLHSTRISSESQLSRVFFHPLPASFESAESRSVRQLPRHALPEDGLVDEAALQSYRQMLDICTTTAGNAFLKKRRSGKTNAFPAKRMRRTWRSTHHRRSAPSPIDSLLSRLCHEVLADPQTGRQK